MNLISTHENSVSHRFSRERRFLDEPDRSPGPCYYDPNNFNIMSSTPSSRN